MRYFLFLSFFLIGSTFNGKCQAWGDSTIKNERVFSSAETAPKFPGGLQGYYKFLSGNLKMPKDNFSKFSFKMVVVRIYLDTTGKVAFSEIANGLNENYNNEVIEMVKKMPSWSPALQNGHRVPYQMNIPILFVD